VIMGANIGTTVTAQITAFNLGAYAPIILFIGAVMYLFLKKNTVKHIGSIIMGFGMLFFGISVIKSAIVPLSESESFISFLTTLSNPAIAIIFGVLFTALLQSSSSSVVIFQTFAVQGLLSYEMTVYLVIGAAIGSVTPNILASLTTNRNGKRTAALNLIFNLFRAVIMVILINVIPGFLPFIKGLTPDSIGHQVANTHTIFAILAVLIEIWFSGAIVALSQKVIPMLPEENKKLEDRKLHYMVATEVLPMSVLVDQAVMEISRMGEIALNSLKDAVECFFTLDDKLAASVSEAEDTVDYLTDTITERLIALQVRESSEKEQHQISQLMLIVSDIERISDHAENIIEYEEQLKSKKASISEIGQSEIRRLADASVEAVRVSFEVFRTQNYAKLAYAEQLEQEVDELQKEIVNSHIQRLMKDACNPAGGVIFTDISTDLERCSDHAINVAFALAETK
ncbi:MAG: Na/Pi cotransporter family protein, partial [Blautia sp.]|nr:Na/Pi cotransporter family protein [Blautia sp.]